MKAIETLVGCLFESQLADWAAHLSSTYPLKRNDLHVVRVALDSSLRLKLASSLSRLIVLETRIAREGGLLEGCDSIERWNSFFKHASKIQFWESINFEYPNVLDRIQEIVEHQLSAAKEFIERWFHDQNLIKLLNNSQVLGNLISVNFGYGDNHNRGRSVVIVQAEGGAVVYKPRSLAVDRQLKILLKKISAFRRQKLLFDVPSVVDCGAYGWAAFVEHDYAKTEAEIAQFYHGIGECLSIMRLLRGNDFHSENVIASGGSLYIVDCETLFLPSYAVPKSGLGDAVDRAADLLSNSVVGIGLLPTRGSALSFRGVDASGVGALPEEQPVITQPQIIDDGTDNVRIDTVTVNISPSHNQPSVAPSLSQHWQEILNGFDRLNNSLRQLDSDALLCGLLKPFESCTVRYVARATEAYNEILHMLWHPQSLYNPSGAKKRAAELLTDMGENSPFAPRDDSIVSAEIIELLRGDIPIFFARAGDGWFKNPEAGNWACTGNLVTSALVSWRNTDFELDRQSTHASIVSAYINDGWLPREACLRCSADETIDIQSEAKSVAADIMTDVIRHAIWGADNTVSWIAPTYDDTGWSVRPLGPDLYGGLGGVAVLSFAYLHEQRAGRALPLEHVEALCASLRNTLDSAAKHWVARTSRKYKSKPFLSGGFLGLGSLIYTYLLLYKWSGDATCLDTAVLFADGLRESVQAHDTFDILTGSAGAIFSLLDLNKQLNADRYLNLAFELADRICEGAVASGNRVCWPQYRWPNGIGGFAHGASGIASAMARIADISGCDKYRDLAERGFRFEDSLYSDLIGGWRDLRQIENYPTASAWCHGSVGIGLGRLISDPTASELSTRRVVKAAARQTWDDGLGWNSCICHGDLGSWELLNRAVELELQPTGLTKRNLLGSIITALKKNGPICGITRDVFSPSLMSGNGGVAYQLLRAHPNARLPSVATLSM